MLMARQHGMEQTKGPQTLGHRHCVYQPWHRGEERCKRLCTLM